MVLFNQFIFSPEWFYGLDSVLDFFLLIVALIIAFHSYKLFLFSKKNNYKYFSLAFLLFSLGILTKIIINLAIYYDVLESFSLRTMSFLGSTITYYEFLTILGYFAFRMLFLVGIMGIYAVSYKKTSFNDITLFLFFFIIIGMFSHYWYYAFHLTALAFLLFISYFYYKNYIKHKKTSSFFVFLCFLLLSLSQILFIPTRFNSEFYVFAEILQFLGFLSLMFANFVVLRK